MQESERVGKAKKITLPSPLLARIPRQPQSAPLMLILLKIVKVIKTFAFGFCTLWVTSRLEKESAGRLEYGVDRRRTR
jgi:hypothetical protein